MARSHLILLAAATLGGLQAPRAAGVSLHAARPPAASPSTLAVRGTGTASAPVERMILRARLEERGPIAQDVLERLAARRARAQRELAAAAIPGLAVRSAGVRVARAADPADERRGAAAATGGAPSSEVRLADELVLEVAGLAGLAPEALEATAARLIDGGLAAGLELDAAPQAGTGERGLLELAAAEPDALEAAATEAALAHARRRAEAIAAPLGLRIRGVRTVVAGAVEPEEARLAPQTSVRVALEVTFDVE